MRRRDRRNVFATHPTAGPALAPSSRIPFNPPVLPSPRLLLTLASLLTAQFLPAHEAATEMVAAARKFLGTLNPDQAKLASYPLTDPERENWNFVPLERQGLPFKKMSTEQQALGLALLRTGVSHTGMARAQALMAMELVLKELENGAARRDPTLYFVTLFGEPSADKSWGWRFEGHHVAFNFTVVGGQHVFFTPSFLGANPAEVRAGPRKGERVLGEEEDLGLALINSLDAAQRKVAIFAPDALKEIVTTNKKRVDPLAPAGIAYAQLQPAQRGQLVALLKLYLARYRPELAADAFAKVEAAGLDKVTFAWAGGLDRTKQTYYRIQTPTFLIEFDNSQGNGNHIHTAIREFKGDFGHDLLAQHYAREHAAKE